MPVVAKTDSEYQRNFQWNPSRKSRSYSPPLAALKPAAGVPSEIAAKTADPEITTKKRTTVPKQTNTTKYEVEADDYMLLGNNDKFAANVKYRSKSRDRAMNIKKTRKAESDEDLATPEAPRNPAPKVFYDAGAPPRKTKVAAEPLKLSKSVEVQNGRHVPVKPILKAPPEPKVKSKAMKPVQSQSEPVVREASQQQHHAQVKKSNPQHHGKPVDKREKRRGKQHEFVQTDLERGVADSGQEAPADYALKYQKGIAPPRSKGPKRLSEYEMQFKWKKGVPSSPMLDAEQLVYKNNPQAPPFRPDSMAKASEYKSQFHAWQLMKSTPNLTQALKQENNAGRRGSKKALKHKRSRSLEDLTPDQRPAAGVESSVPPEDKRLLKESVNPQRLHFPHGKSKEVPAYSPPKPIPFPRAKKEHMKTLLYHYDLVNPRVRSEYSSNFAPPQKFEYEMGAWRGADPPHIVNRPDTESILSQEGAAQSRAWFSEVVELRQKADEYKRRAQGTHFSRAHMAQLYARQAEMWDTASTVDDDRGSLVSALSLESARSSQASSVKVKKSRGVVGTSLQLDADQLSSARTGTVTPMSERTLTPDVDEQLIDDVDDATSYTASARSVDLTPGRIPTPQLRGKTFAKTRHHLDRTTPSVGGAILTSPTRLDTKVVESKGSHPVHSTVEAWVETPGNVVRGSFSAPGHLGQTKSPAFGKPTHDSHVLVDEETASDHTLRLDFVKSKPQMDRGKQDLATRLSTIKEASGEYRSTGKSSNTKMSAAAVTLDDIPTRGVIDDDAMSLSAQSIASSCSLASEVLERAKNRRNDFWGKK